MSLLSSREYFFKDITDAFAKWNIFHNEVLPTLLFCVSEYIKRCTQANKKSGNLSPPFLKITRYIYQ